MFSMYSIEITVTTLSVILTGTRTRWQDNIQGHPERMLKVKNRENSFFSCSSLLDTFLVTQTTNLVQYNKSAHFIQKMWFQRLASRVCFQALVSCLRPTIDPEILSKDWKWLFELTRRKFSSMNMFIAFKPLYLAFTNSNIHLGSLLRVSKSVVGLKQPTRAKKHIWGTSLWNHIFLMKWVLLLHCTKFVGGWGH